MQRRRELLGQPRSMQQPARRVLEFVGRVRWWFLPVLAKSGRNGLQQRSLPDRLVRGMPEWADAKRIVQRPRIMPSWNAVPNVLEWSMGLVQPVLSRGLIQILRRRFQALWRCAVHTGFRELLQLHGDGSHLEGRWQHLHEQRESDDLLADDGPEHPIWMPVHDESIVRNRPVQSECARTELARRHGERQCTALQSVRRWRELHLGKRLRVEVLKLIPVSRGRAGRAFRARSSTGKIGRAHV